MLEREGKETRSLMLVDTMEYMGQSGVGSLQGGGVQDDAFLELLSNTGLASASSHANGNKAQIASPELDFGSDDVLPSYDFKSTSSSLANQTTASSSGRKGEGTPGFLPQPSDYSSHAVRTLNLPFFLFCRGLVAVTVIVILEVAAVVVPVVA